MIIEDDKNALAQQTNAEGHPDDAPPAYHAPPGQSPYAAQGPEKSQPPQETLSFPQGPPTYGAGPSSGGSGYAQASSSRAAPNSVPNPAPSTSSKPGDLLNPPPPSFSRPPQQGFPYPPFHTMVHLSLGKSLDKGFPIIPPGSAVQPHPFMTHDVNEEDWTRFLGDLKKAGTLSPMDKILATGTPIVLGLPVVGIVGSIFLGGSFAERMKNKKSGPASQLVDHWNHYFFHPRLMEVSLCRGHKVYSGINKGRPADMHPHTHHDPNHNGYDSDSSSSSSSSDDSRHGSRRAERRARRAERRAERRERRRQRREERQERRGQDTQGDKPWRLVVVFRPLPGAPAPNPTTL